MMLSLFILFACIPYRVCDCKTAASIKERVLEVIDEFCPGVDICLENSSTNSSSVNFRHVFWSCCTECKCRPNCTEDNSCCFPPKLPKVYFENEFENLEIVEECMFPTTTQQNQVYVIKYESFYMVTSVTKQRQTKPTTNTKNKCGDEIVAPWGSMFPVYSSKKKKIYKNRICAEADEVTDGIIWDAVVICKSNYNHIEASVSIVEFQTYDFRDCSVDFIPPNTKGIKELKCYLSLIDTCSETEFEPPLETGLSKMDIKEMCESGFVSPFAFTKLYANVFCFICNSKILPDSLHCNTSKYSIGENRENYGEGFIGLIDSRFVLSNSGKIVDRAKIPTVCNPKDVSRCRPILCPTGQLRDKSGKCKFLNKLWYNQEYVVYIHLSSDTSFDVNEIKDIRKSLSSQRALPFLRRWKIDSISHELRQETRNCTSLLVIMIYKASKVRPSYLMQSVNKLLLYNWKLDLNNETIALKSSFSKSLYLYDGRTNRIAFGDLSEEIMAPVHHVLYRNTELLVNIHVITKLNFCKQVEISSSEFNISEKQTFLFNKLTQQVMFDGEFLLLAAHYSGGARARICLEDSGMIEIENGSCKITAMLRTIVFFEIVFWTM